MIQNGTPAAHVIYINTALDTKANANAVVPTVTCTSSNVVQTVLQLAFQVPNIEIFYGPDTYMGGNLAHLFSMMAGWSDAEVAEVHPQHTAATIQSLLPRLKYYQDGTCMVHHMFGKVSISHLPRSASLIAHTRLTLSAFIVSGGFLDARLGARGLLSVCGAYAAVVMGAFAAQPVAGELVAKITGTG